MVLHVWKLTDDNLIITGEGRVNGQFVHGKAIDGITQLANKHDIPVVVIAGGVDTGYKALYKKGVQSILTLPNKPMSLKYAMNHTKELLEETIFDFCQILNLNIKFKQKNN